MLGSTGRSWVATLLGSSTLRPSAGRRGRRGVFCHLTIQW